MRRHHAVMKLEAARAEIEKAASKLIEERGDGYANVDPKTRIFEVLTDKAENGKTTFVMYWWGLLGNDTFGIRGQHFNAVIEEYLTRAVRDRVRVLIVTENKRC